MKPNMGAVDRLARIILGIIFFIILLSVANNIIVKIILGIFSLGLITTGILAFCPVYVPLKITTVVNKKNRK